MSGASEQAKGRASGPVLPSVFLVVLAHSVIRRLVRLYRTLLLIVFQTLLFTGQSSSPEVSGKRYFATLLYILQWYDVNITDPESKGYKVTLP